MMKWKRPLSAVACAVAFAAVLVAASWQHVAALSVIRTDENVSLSGAAYPVGPLIDVATAATATSTPLEMRVLSGLSVQVDHGNITGTLVLQGSNDGVTYYAVPDVAFTAISGSGGEIVEIYALSSRFYRFVYTHSSGTGLLKVTPYVKGRN